jgi:hypothetical protein
LTNDFVRSQGGFVSQIILYQGGCGIVLTTDSRAVRFTESGEPRYFTISKLYPLRATILLATVGAGYGHSLCRAFQMRVQQMRLARGEDIIDLAFPFFRDAVQAHPTDASEQKGDPELQKVYFIIAGTITGNPDNPLGFAVYAAEHGADPLHPLSTGHFVCIPRQLSLERRLLQLTPGEVSWEQVEELCTNFLVRLASSSEDIGAPFIVSRISTGGIHNRIVEASTAQVP